MNFYENDLVMQRILKQKLDPEMYRWADETLRIFGKHCATEIDERAKHTDREGQPRLVKYDRFGEDISEVWVNEGYKRTVIDTYNTGIVGYVHKEIPKLGKKGNYLYSYAQGYLLSQSEPGFYCPVTLSMATALLLDRFSSEQVKERFLPHVLSTGETELYEGATFLTERQGGSDVGANETKAIAKGESYILTGEKYFASNAGMCGVAMVLARIEGDQEGTRGLSLFAVPWRDEDGSLNGITIRRLKDKLGVRAVPSAEVEFKEARGYLVGEVSKGIYYMMEALNLSRICNAVASIGIMRRALQEALDYAKQRHAFKRALIDYPMVQETLLNLTVKHEVETLATFELVEQYDQLMSKDERALHEEAAYVRLLIAIIKKESAEQAIHFSHEAIEMLGGNGYIEDFVTPRLLRDAQVLTVWEGTANILGLEIIRLMNKTKVHCLFIKRMRHSVLDVPTSLTKSRDLILNEIDTLERLTQFIEGTDEDTKTYYAKKLAKQMVLVFEAQVALLWAKQGTKREEKIVEHFCKLSFNQDRAFEDATQLKDDFNLIVQ